MLADGRPLERDRLAAQLWSDTSSHAARHALRQLLYRLRGLGVPLVLDADRVRLPAALVTTTLDLAVALDTPPSALGGALREALADRESSVGPWLPGYAPDLSPDFDDWLDAERSRVEARLRRACEAMLAEDRAPDVAERRRVATTLLSLDPLNRRAHATLRVSPVEGDLPHPVVVDAPDAREAPGHRSWADTARWRIPIGRWHASIDAARATRTAGIGASAPAPSTGEATVLRALLAGVARAGASVVRIDLSDSGLSAESPGTRLVQRLLDAPGALGCSPDALASLRRWTAASSDPDRRGEASRSTLLPEEELRELLDALCDEAPLVVLLETDPRTSADWRLLSGLSRVTDHRRMLVLAMVVAGRPGERDPPVGS